MSSRPSPSGVRVPAWSQQHRIQDLETKLLRHIDQDTGHSILAGYHRWVYDDANNRETYTIYADSSLRKKRYERITKYDTADSSHVVWQRVTFFKENGAVFKRLLFKNYRYTTDGTNRDAGVDVIVEK